MITRLSAAGRRRGLKTRGRAARQRLAALLTLIAHPLLDAQQRAWECGDRTAVLLAGAIVRTLINVVAGRLHIDGSRRREEIAMADGERLTIFRQMHLDAPGAPHFTGEFRVRFHSRMAPRLNEWFSWLTIPLFSGLPGFRDKTWLVNGATGFSAGIYHWQTIEDASRYAHSPALAFMTRRSLPDTVSHWVGPPSPDLDGPWPPEGKEEPGWVGQGVRG
jgi:hypothetical protein